MRITEKVFVNFTNHPSDLWEEIQRAEAEKYGKILDIPFPTVDPKGDEAYISRLADECVRNILCCHPAAVLCQGEFTLAYQVISRLKAKGICVLAACSMRNVRTDGNKKEVIFEFEQFREYQEGLR